MNEMYGLHFNCQVRDLMKSGLIECAIWFGLLFCVGFDTYNTSDRRRRVRNAGMDLECTRRLLSLSASYFSSLCSVCLKNRF